MTLQTTRSFGESLIKLGNECNNKWIKSSRVLRCALARDGTVSHEFSVAGIKDDSVACFLGPFAYHTCMLTVSVVDLKQLQAQCADKVTENGFHSMEVVAENGTARCYVVFL